MGFAWLPRLREHIGNGNPIQTRFAQLMTPHRSSTSACPAATA
jgi:hypothetical protein